MTTSARIVLGIVLLVVALVLGLVGSQMFARAQIRASDAQRRVERYASPDTSELTSAQAALAGVCALLLVALVSAAGGAILLLRAVAAGGRASPQTSVLPPPPLPPSPPPAATAGAMPTQARPAEQSNI